MNDREKLIKARIKAEGEIEAIELSGFGNDYLSLLKAGVVSSGMVPPCFENKDISLKKLLHKLLGKPGGIEVVTKVNSIPKGSRLACKYNTPGNSHNPVNEIQRTDN